MNSMCCYALSIVQSLICMKEIKEAFSKCLKQFPFPICQQDLINVSFPLFGMQLMTSAADLTSASSVINQLMFTCSATAWERRLGLPSVRRCNEGPCLQST